MSLGSLGNGEIKQTEITGKTTLVEMVDVGLSAYLRSIGIVIDVDRPAFTNLFLDGEIGRLDVRIVGPTGIEMETEDVAPRTLSGVGNSSKKVVEIVQTAVEVIVALRIDVDRGVVGKAIATEIGTWSVHHAMQHDLIALRIDQMVALNGEA